MRYDEQVLGIPLLCTLGEVETPGDDGLPVNHNDFVVGDPMGRVDVGGDSLIGEEGCTTIPLTPLRFVEDHLNINSPVLCIYESPGDGGRGEAVSLDEDGLLRYREGINDCFGTSSAGAEIRMEILLSLLRPTRGGDSEEKGNEEFHQSGDWGIEYSRGVETLNEGVHQLIGDDI